jgi:hypothetical protein
MMANKHHEQPHAQEKGCAVFDGNRSKSTYNLSGPFALMQRGRFH